MKHTHQNPFRIAMWSGPRNVSTALMRSWENRPDAWVCDEPFYGHYLKQTGVQHPGADEVIARMEQDWRAVVGQILGPIPEGRFIYYQKHMAHHLLPDMGRDWLEQLNHCFLIRHPREMLPSLDEKYARPKIEDTGLPQQVEIFNFIRERSGVECPVIDSRDLLNDPERILRKLCEHWGLKFYPEMLSWPPGPRKTDGVWAKHWYHNVEKSTGFKPYKPKTEPLAAHLTELRDACMEPYEALRRHCLA